MKLSILFLRGNTIWSKLIKKVTKSEFSHVALVLDENLIIDADGFKRIYMKKIPSDWDYEIVETDIEVDKFRLYEICQPFFNKEYDYLNIVTQFLSYLLGRFPLIEVKNRFTCVEFVCAILRLLGYQIDEETPICLYRKLLEEGRKKNAKYISNK